MSQITGLRVGTPFADSFIGSVEFIGSVTDLADEARSAISNASIYTYDGNDIIVGISEIWNSQGQLGLYQVYGVYQGYISSGNGDDILRFEASANSYTFATAVGIYNATLNGDQGNDTIQIDVSGHAEYGGGYAYGQIKGIVNGGSGHDRIEISVFGSGRGGTATGVDQGSIFGDHGNDQIDITASGSGQGGGSVGITQSLVDGGADHDSITIDSQGFGSRGGGSSGASQSEIRGGSGNDAITVTTTFGGRGTAFGLFNTQIQGNQGDDLIDISATSTDSASQAYGVMQSRVYGGNGQDTFMVRGTTLALSDALIDGGNGKDTFDVGIGSGTVEGGNATDLIFLNFFDADTMTVQALANNGLRITGTADSFGQPLNTPWTQTITNMEQFQVGSNLFTNARDVADFLQNSP